MQTMLSNRYVSVQFSRILSLFLVFIQRVVGSWACIKCCSLSFPSIVCHKNSFREIHRKRKKNAICFGFFSLLFQKFVSDEHNKATLSNYCHQKWSIKSNKNYEREHKDCLVVCSMHFWYHLQQQLPFRKKWMHSVRTKDWSDCTCRPSKFIVQYWIFTIKSYFIQWNWWIFRAATPNATQKRVASEATAMHNGNCISARASSNI